MSKQKKLFYKGKAHKEDEGKREEPESYSTEERNMNLDDFNDEMSDISDEPPASSRGHNNNEEDRKDTPAPPPPPPPSNYTSDDDFNDKIALALLRAKQPTTHKHLGVGSFMDSADDH